MNKEVSDLIVIVAVLIAIAVGLWAWLRWKRINNNNQREAERRLLLDSAIQIANIRSRWQYFIQNNNATRHTSMPRLLAAFDEHLFKYGYSPIGHHRGLLIYLAIRDSGTHQDEVLRQAFEQVMPQVDLR